MLNIVTIIFCTSYNSFLSSSRVKVRISSAGISTMFSRRSIKTLMCRNFVCALNRILPLKFDLNKGRIRFRLTNSTSFFVLLFRDTFSFDGFSFRFSTIDDLLTESAFSFSGAKNKQEGRHYVENKRLDYFHNLTRFGRLRKVGRNSGWGSCIYNLR